MKRLSVLCLLVICSLLVGKLWHIAKDGFHIHRTLCQLSDASLPPPDFPIEEVLNQTYTYLGRGHQCYAFGSEDGKYVIKLPRFDRYRLSFFLRACPFPFLRKNREEVRVDLQRRCDFLLESFRIAFEDLREETALLYVHLNQTDNLSGSLKIKDRLGRAYTLDPNRTPFLIQEKKPIMMACFEEFLRTGNRKGAEEILESFLDLVSIRSLKGIYNKDPSFLRNFGWEEGRGVQIDIGSFYRKPFLSAFDARDKSFQETAQHVRNWLQELDPEMLAVFNQKIQAIQNSWPKQGEDLGSQN